MGALLPETPGPADDADLVLADYGEPVVGDGAAAARVPAGARARVMSTSLVDLANGLAVADDELLLLTKRGQCALAPDHELVVGDGAGARRVRVRGPVPGRRGAFDHWRVVPLRAAGAPPAAGSGGGAP